MYSGSIRLPLPITNKERANPNSANVIVMAKSSLDSLARDTLRYIIFLHIIGRENETNGCFGRRLNTVDPPRMYEVFHTSLEFSSKSTERNRTLIAASGFCAVRHEPRRPHRGCRRRRRSAQGAGNQVQSELCNRDGDARVRH
jgi:hypothetical protein